MCCGRIARVALCITEYGATTKRILLESLCNAVNHAAMAGEDKSLNSRCLIAIEAVSNGVRG